MLELGVNIDHVCTVRQARRETEPSPLDAAELAEQAGAFGITAHLREDRRHILDADIVNLAKQVKALNMEMAATEEMVSIALDVKPNSCCIVPEKREELTTEGGLDVLGNIDYIKECTGRLQEKGILVSLFIDAVEEQIRAAADAGADYIELHTGTFANASGDEQLAELDRLIAGAELANSLGIKVNAGHGIDYVNIELIKKIPHLHELNIGFSIVGRALMVGMKQATEEMITLMKDYSL